MREWRDGETLGEGVERHCENILEAQAASKSADVATESLDLLRVTHQILCMFMVTTRPKGMKFEDAVESFMEQWQRMVLARVSEVRRNVMEIKSDLEAKRAEGLAENPQIFDPPEPPEEIKEIMSSVMDAMKKAGLDGHIKAVPPGHPLHRFLHKDEADKELEEPKNKDEADLEFNPNNIKVRNISDRLN